jgi:hypothetical protein
MLRYKISEFFSILLGHKQCFLISVHHGRHGLLRKDQHPGGTLHGHKVLEMLWQDSLLVDLQARLPFVMNLLY